MSVDPKEKTELKERCYRYSISLIRFLNALPGRNVNHSLVNQLLRSGTSIGANVVEAKSASSRKDFTRYYEIALKSTNETKYWLGLFKDALDIDSAEIQFLINETDEIAKIIASSILSLKGKREF